MISIKNAFVSLFVVAAVTFAAPMTAKAASSGTDTPAAKFVEKMGANALTSLTDKSIDAKEREKRVRDLLRTNFDLQTIGRYALGAYWKDATDAQKKEYQSLFEDMIVKTYSQRFGEYSGQSFKVSGAVPSGSKDNIVSSQIVQKDGPPVSVDWRVRNKDGQMKIIDVIVESISMSVTQRSDFASVIQKSGIDGLITSLKTRRVKAAGG